MKTNISTFTNLQIDREILTSFVNFDFCVERTARPEPVAEFLRQRNRLVVDWNF